MPGLFLCLPLVLASASPTGECVIGGRIEFGEQDVYPLGMAVTCFSVEEKKVSAAYTDESGEFCFSDLPPGVYDLYLRIDREMAETLSTWHIPLALGSVDTRDGPVWKRVQCVRGVEVIGVLEDPSGATRGGLIIVKTASTRDVVSRADESGHFRVRGVDVREDCVIEVIAKGHPYRIRSLVPNSQLVAGETVDVSRYIALPPDEALGTVHAMWRVEGSEDVPASLTLWFTSQDSRVEAMFQFRDGRSSSRLPEGKYAVRNYRLDSDSTGKYERLNVLLDVVGGEAVELSVTLQHKPDNRAVVVSLESDDEGIECEMSSGESELMYWEEIDSVAIHTTYGGPYRDEGAYVVLASSAATLWVPRAIASPVLQHFIAFPGFRFDKLNESGCQMGNKEFVIWLRPIP